MFNHNIITVVGGGLAGSEAALQIADRGISVELYEMRPVLKTPAHVSDSLAELVCSNSFGSLSDHTAPWILKRELSHLNSHLLRIGMANSVPAGRSLAIDRKKFQEAVTAEIISRPNIVLKREEVTEMPKGITVIATGPLTSPSLSCVISNVIGQDSLYFYDAISPIISADSIDFEKLFCQSRYDKGTPDFWNIPLERDQYEHFVSDLLSGEVVLPHAFEEGKYFESCLPIEVIAERGPMTLAFGPMKPVGLRNPKTGMRPFAVVQLRAENAFQTAYNLVGFQTKLKYPEQERIFRKLSGLENAEFLRLGSMHRNTYIHSPRFLEPTLQLKKNPQIFIAGQLTGTEGYVESIATGLLAGMNAVQLLLEKGGVVPPPEMMMGALIAKITDRKQLDFQPTNSNMGLLPPLTPMSGSKKLSKQERNEAMSKRAFDSMKNWNLTQTMESYRPRGALSLELDGCLPN